MSWGRASSCTGKVRFASRKAARKARAAMQGRGMGQGHLQAYKCEWCSWFHLGHMPAAVAAGEVDKSDWRLTKDDRRQRRVNRSKDTASAMRRVAQAGSRVDQDVPDEGEGR